jgi:pyruvate kinase
MHTKIVCTIGPASKSKTKLTKMIRAGMSVARINSSHGTHETNGELIKNVRRASSEVKANVGIMVDLQGPRIRIKKLKREIHIRKGQEIFFYEGKNGASTWKGGKVYLGIDSKNLLKHMKLKDVIYIDNGMMEVEVIKKSRRYLKCKVLVGGIVKSRKGVNIPRIALQMEALTKSDKVNLEFALSQNVDFIAMSFVRIADDIKKLKKLIKKMLPGVDASDLPEVIAKIETREAVVNFDEILKEVDGVMIARGDLGIELPVEQIPMIQKDMIKKCMDNAKPVIVATQMLESMMENPRPTRAEITDVSNAVIDHTDAVMLSGESAMGLYPLKTVQVMFRIIGYTEESPYDDIDYNKMPKKELIPFVLVARSAVSLAVEMGFEHLVIRNTPLMMAYKVARFRPEINIWYFTKNKVEARRLSLVWGVKAVEKLEKVRGGFVLIDGVSNENGKIEYRITRNNNRSGSMSIK